MLKEDPPSRWTIDDSDMEYYISIFQDFADKLPEKVKKPVVDALEKWKKGK